MKYEEELLQIINQVKDEITHFEESAKGINNVIMLIGKVGCGKSTIFNMLVGAKFKAKSGERRFVLDLDCQQSQFSFMGYGQKQVTKVPKCYYDPSYQHLIVDFPGFNDSNSWQENFIIETLFNKIAQKSNLKLVLVSYQPEEAFPNRGVDLQDFVKSVISNNNVELNSISLLMNRYSGDTPVENLVEELQSQIQQSLKQKARKIIIQKAIRNEYDLEQFQQSNRQKEIWEELIQTPPLKLQQCFLRNKEIINSYLIESMNFIYLTPLSALNQQLHQSEFQLKNKEQEGIIHLLKSLRKLLQKADSNNIVIWMTEYLTHLNEIGKMIEFQKPLNIQVQNFRVIFTFFFDLSQQIENYKQVVSIIKQMIIICDMIIQNLSNQFNYQQQIHEALSEISQEKEKVQYVQSKIEEINTKKNETERERQEAETNLRIQNSFQPKETEDKNRQLQELHKQQFKSYEDDVISNQQYLPMINQQERVPIDDPSRQNQTDQKQNFIIRWLYYILEQLFNIQWNVQPNNLQGQRI